MVTGMARPGAGTLDGILLRDGDAARQRVEYPDTPELLPVAPVQVPEPQELFDPQHAVSYRVWDAIARDVAEHNPRLLDSLFSGVEFETQGLNDGRSHRFPDRIRRYMSAETATKYGHLVVNSSEFGSMSTRLALFENLVDVLNDDFATFKVGRKINIRPEFGLLRAAFENPQAAKEQVAKGPAAKALAMIVGINPGKAVMDRMAPANRALNRFLDTTPVAYGPNHLDVRVQYLRPTDISTLGDLFTLGAIVSGLEQISYHKLIEIKCQQSPFDFSIEADKQRLSEPGIKYTAEGYRHDPSQSVFLYRFQFHEKAGLGRRLLRAPYNWYVSNFRASKESRAQSTLGEQHLRLLQAGEKVDALTQVNQQIREKLSREVDAVNERYAKQAELYEALDGVAKGVAHDIGRDAGGVVKIGNELLDQLLGQSSPRSYSDLQHLRSYEDPTIAGLANMLLLNRTALELPAKLTEQKQNLETTHLNYNALVGGVMNDVPHLVDAPGLRYTNNVPANLEVRAHEGDYRTALINIIKNSAEASQQVGGEISVNAEAIGDDVLLTIREPVVIPDHIAQQLSYGEKFESEKEGGHGIGHIASYQIIKRHGGTISYVPRGTYSEILIRMPGKVAYEMPLQPVAPVDLDSLFDNI